MRDILDVELGHCRPNGVYYADTKCEECTRKDGSGPGDSEECDLCIHNPKNDSEGTEFKDCVECGVQPDEHGYCVKCGDHCDTNNYDDCADNFNEHPCVSCSSRGRACSRCGEAG